MSPSYVPYSDYLYKSKERHRGVREEGNTNGLAAATNQNQVRRYGFEKKYKSFLARGLEYPESIRVRDCIRERIDGQVGTDSQTGTGKEETGGPT